MPNVSEDLARKLGFEGVRHLLKLSVGSGKVWLSANHPGLTQLETQEALSLCKAPQSINIPRNRFNAVAWLLGASWGQLAAYAGVTRSSIQSATRSIMPVDTRQNLRIRAKATEEDISSINEAFNHLVAVDPGIVMALGPVELAKMIYDRIGLHLSDYGEVK